MIWSLGLSASGPDGADALRYAYGPAIGAENLSRFRNADFDRIYLEQGQLPNAPERLAKLRELQRILIAWAPMNNISHRYAIDMTYPWVIGFRRWPFAQNWWQYVDLDTDLRQKTVGR